MLSYLALVSFLFFFVYVCAGIGFVDWLQKWFMYIWEILKCVFAYDWVWLSLGEPVRLTGCGNPVTVKCSWAHCFLDQHRYPTSTAPLAHSVVWPLTVSEAPWPVSGVALDSQWSPLDCSVVWPLTVTEAPLTAQWCGPWLSVKPPWPVSGVALDCQCSPHDTSVVWPLTISAAPLTPLMKPLDLSVAWPLTVSAAPFIPLMKPPWLLSGVALDCQCSPLDPSVAWPLTVSAAPLTTQWCGPWLSVQPQSVRFCVCSSQWTLAWWNRCPRTSHDRGSPITRWTSCG